MKLDDRDLDRWNSQFGDYPPRKAAIVIRETVVAIVAFRGKLTNPLAIGQMDGVSPPTDLELILKASSLAP